MFFVYFFNNFNDYNSASGFALVHVCFNIDKDADCFLSNNSTSSNDLWLPFSTLFFFLKVCFNNISNIKLRLFVILIIFYTSILKNPGHLEVIRTCSRQEIFTFAYIDTCEDIQSLIIQLTIDHFSI